MATLNDQESAIETFVEILEEHRRNSERLGKYVEAEIARKRLDELRAHEEARRREALRARQLAEVLAVEEAHMLEFQQFNAMWDAKMQSYEINGEQLMGAMKERHSDELREYSVDDSGIRIGTLLADQEGLLGGRPATRHRTVPAIEA